MARRIKVIVHTRCALPIQADAAATVGVPQCRCSGHRRLQEMRLYPVAEQRPIAMCVRSGILALEALAARQPTRVDPSQLDAILQRAEPALRPVHVTGRDHRAFV